MQYIPYAYAFTKENCPKCFHERDKCICGKKKTKLSNVIVIDEAMVWFPHNKPKEERSMIKEVDVILNELEEKIKNANQSNNKKPRKRTKRKRRKD